ncbi:putative DNA-binding helix-turn-helix protein [uncultured Eubacteriales bacterium]|uniref:Putative DNA-binding helix-turn-helix protein n=1 Tax=uncultured Eubacteriales bacterium TaxID=172733 RepID=A0A212J9T5_9FIRM|nr:putative DNA-binding helix-turn-helix protein [uncultured Eubacteriales bacterium]
MEVDYEELGNNIKVHRIRNRLKQAQLAELVDVSAQHISHIECGKTKLGLPLLLRLSEVLSVNLYTLLGSNVASPPDAVAVAELAGIVKGATHAQQQLCLELCRTAMEQTKDKL